MNDRFDEVYGSDSAKKPTAKPAYKKSTSNNKYILNKNLSILGYMVGADKACCEPYEVVVDKTSGKTKLVNAFSIIAPNMLGDTGVQTLKDYLSQAKVVGGVEDSVLLRRLYHSHVFEGKSEDYIEANKCADSYKFCHKIVQANASIIGEDEAKDYAYVSIFNEDGFGGKVKCGKMGKNGEWKATDGDLQEGDFCIFTVEMVVCQAPMKNTIFIKCTSITVLRRHPDWVAKGGTITEEAVINSAVNVLNNAAAMAYLNKTAETPLLRGNEGTAAPTHNGDREDDLTQ